MYVKRDFKTATQCNDMIYLETFL